MLDDSLKTSSASICHCRKPLTSNIFTMLQSVATNAKRCQVFNLRGTTVSPRFQMVKVDRSLTKRGSANKAKFVLQKKDFSFLGLTGQPSAVSHLSTLQHRNPASLMDWSG
jgi:hypothetical protein